MDELTGPAGHDAADGLEEELTALEDAVRALRLALRGRGLAQPPQRVRVTARNRHLLELRELIDSGGGDLGPREVAERLGISPEYAYDLFAALMASGEVERVAAGRYRRTLRPTGPVRP